MENETFLNKIPTQIGESATVKNVFGEPIHAGDKVIIPVARIAYGFGGGFGKGNMNGKAAKKEEASKKDDEAKNKSGEGGGGGGGMYATAKGVYVISPNSNKYIPASNTGHIVLGIVAGFLLRGFVKGRRKK